VILALLIALAAEPTVDPPGITDRLAEASWDRAVSLRRAGRHKEAATAFETLAAERPYSRRAVQALAAAGTLYRWELNDTSRAKQLWVQALAGPSDVPGSDGALNELLALARDESGVDGELSVIRDLAVRRTHASYAPRLWVKAATILLEELKKPGPALDAAKSAVIVAEGTTWWDDAAFLAGRCHLELGQYDEALDHFRRIIATHEITLIGGDENSDLLDDAYFYAAKTLEKAGRMKDAEKAYYEVADERKRSPYVDDALQKAHDLAMARKDPIAAGKYLDLLIRLRPASRYLLR